MTDGKAVLTVRYAMLFCVLKRRGVLDDARNRDPWTQHVVAANPKQLSSVLSRAKFEFDDAGSFEEARQ
jgi:hypothetical protein